MKLFKVLLTLILTLLFSSTILGQSQIKFGFKAGLNMANAIGDDSEIEGGDKKIRMGLAAGMFMVYDLTDMIAIQPELYYSMQGVNYEEKGGDGELNLKVDYIQIPVLFKYMFSGNSAQPHIFAGPALGINISAKQVLKGGGQEKEEDIKDTIKSTDFSLVFGAGVNFDQFSIDLRYLLGLTNIPDEGNDKVNNGVIAVMLGYTLP